MSIIKVLSPIRAPLEEIEELEKRLQKMFLEEIFLPLIHGQKIPELILNSTTDYQGLTLALSSGRVTFNRGVFSGHFTAASTVDLKKMGAEWDAKTKTFHYPTEKLPIQIRGAIRLSEDKFKTKLSRMDDKLAALAEAQPWKNFTASDLFNKAIFRMDKDFANNVEKVGIVPEVPKVLTLRAQKIAGEWQENLDIKIKGFSDKQILELRKQIKQCYFTGDRAGDLIKTIQKAHGKTERYATFLARQETHLLVSAYSTAKYQDVGIDDYYWRAVKGTKLHPTRHRHAELSRMSAAGKTFKFSDPPNTAEPNQPAYYANPGQPFNCRCVAIPVRKAA